MENNHARRLGQPPPLPFIVEPTSQHKQSIILLHGLGNNGRDFGSTLLANSVCSDGRTLAQVFPSTRFIFPTSWWRRTSAYDNALLTSWFDIASLDDPYDRDGTQRQGLEESRTEVIELVRSEVDAVGAENVILGGFGQGMATSLISLLLLEFPLAGYIGISGWLPFCWDLEGHAGLRERQRSPEVVDVLGPDQPDETPPNIAANAVFGIVKLLMSFPEPPDWKWPSGFVSTPVFLGHGTADEKINQDHSERASKVLKAMGFEVESKSYQGLGHTYKVPDEIDDIVDFIRRQTGWE